MLISVIFNVWYKKLEFVQTEFHTLFLNHMENIRLAIKLFISTQIGTIFVYIKYMKFKIVFILFLNNQEQTIL